MAADDSLIKKPYAKVAYNAKQVEELKACMHPITGPEYFISNFMYVQHPTMGRTQLKLFDFQVELLHNYHNYRKSINMLSRQMGKSTVAGGYLLWYAMFIPDSTILVASNKFEGAQEIMGRIRYAYESMPDHIRSGVRTYNKRSIEFDNGSRIVATATTENTGRGMSLSLIYLDEYSFVQDTVARDLYTSLAPTLSTGGKIIITSTPSSAEDQFAELWFGALKTIGNDGTESEIGANGYRAFKAIWDRHPHRDAQWGKDELAAIGPDRFAREHECEFVSFEETLISGASLHRLEGSKAIEIDENKVRWFSRIRPECTYVVGLDPSMGTGGDNAAIQVVELPTLVQVAEWGNNRTLVEDQVRVLNDILVKIDNAGVSELYWSLENNGLGEAALVVIRDTGEEKFPGVMLHDHQNKPGKSSKRCGYTTTSRSKIEACARMKSLIESSRLKINSKLLIAELHTFVSRAKSFEARIGMTDDMVMSMILCLRMIDYIALWDEESHKAISSKVNTDDDFDAPMPILI